MKVRFLTAVHVTYSGDRINTILCQFEYIIKMKKTFKKCMKYNYYKLAKQKLF